MNFPEWLAAARVHFPQINEANSWPTSPADAEYNCIAWAAEDAERWWWPDSQEQKYWPQGVRRSETIDAFVEAYRLIGYERTIDASLESGRQKLAIFADERGVPTHAARQLANGLWTSKLGQQIDIEHDLYALEGPTYGSVIVVLARPIL